MSPSKHIRRIPLAQILPGTQAARDSYAPEGIAALTASIRRFGLLSPLLLRRCGAGQYELIAGGRRLQALQRLGCREAEAVVLSAYDSECALISLIENLEREELHFLDEAEACRRIIDIHGFTQEELAALLSRSPSALANRLRLMKLGAEVQRCIRETRLSERHARALLRLKEDEARLRLARQAAEGKWSVRRLEGQIDAALKGPASLPEPPRFRDRRLVINAFRNTVKALQRLGVEAVSRVEEREDSYDVIITVRTKK